MFLENPCGGNYGISGVPGGIGLYVYTRGMCEVDVAGC